MKKILSVNTLILELLLYFWIFSFFFFFSFNSVYYQNELLLYLTIQFLIWFFIFFRITSFCKFDYTKNYYNSLAPFIKSYILFLIISIPFLYLFSFPPYVIKKIYFASVIYVLWSYTFQTFRYVTFKPHKTDEIDLKFLKATTYPELEELRDNSSLNDQTNTTTTDGISGALSEKLYRTYLSKCPMLFNFISSKIDLNRFDEKKSVIIRSSDPYNVKVLQNNLLEFFLNLHELNDIRRINEYLILLNNKLKNGGIYIGKFEPTRYRYRRFLRDYSSGLAQFFYFFDFLWRRVTPKLPVVRKFYFAVTKGKDRAISLAEGLGRLYYSGFEVISLFEEGNFITFIAKKVKLPSTDKSPSYGPLFKMRRVGKEGKDIFVYKFRTMHPYSEYLQQFVFERNALEEGGKLKDDFRITYWGRILRKLWVDELPMFINVFKGEMKLVGVRPLSKHYFGLYPKELQEKRIKTKPGLVPPFYVDMPKTMDEIVASELKYLAQYEKTPLKTDIKYFVKSFYNILIKKARSG